MKKRSRLTFALAVSLMMAAAAVSGCGSGQSSTSTVAGDSGSTSETADTTGQSSGDAEETLRVITYFAGSDQWAPTWLEVIAEYQELHPNITINDESVPTAGTNDLFRPKMNADIAAGTPVDVALYFNGSDAEPLYESGLYVTWDQ